MAGVMFHQQHLSGIKPSLRVDRLFASDGSMHKRKRGKTVTWPPDEKICEVRLYDNLTENLSVKQSITRGILQSHSSSRDKQDLRTGLEVTSKRARKNEPPVVSLTAEKPWCCPPKILLESAWMVAVGDESVESNLQPDRERKELEAIYPRTSSIPYSPIEPPVDYQNVDDASIPQIPTIAVEDEDEYDGNIQVGDCLAGDCSVKDCPKLDNNQATSKLNCDLHNEVPTTDHGPDKVKSAADPEIAAAAAAACMALKAVGGSSLVDEELLVKILTNPALLKPLLVGGEGPGKLVRESHIGLENKSLSNGNNHEPQNIVPTTISLAAGGGVMHEKNGISPLTFVGKSVVSSSHIASSTGVQVPRAQMHLRAAECTFSPSASTRQEESAVTVSRRRTLADYSNRLVPEMGVMLDVRKANVSTRVSTNLPRQSHASPSFQVSHQHDQHRTRVPVLSNPPSLIDRKSSSNTPRAESVVDVCCGAFHTHDASMMHYWQQKSMGNLNGKCEQTKHMQVNPKLCVDARNNQNSSAEPRDSCNKPRKLCVYFHSRRGCKKGANCDFLHQSMQSEMESRCISSFVR